MIIIIIPKGITLRFLPAHKNWLPRIRKEKKYIGMDDIILFELPRFSMNRNVERNQTFTKGLQILLKIWKIRENSNKQETSEMMMINFVCGTCVVVVCKDHLSETEILNKKL